MRSTTTRARRVHDAQWPLVACTLSAVLLLPGAGWGWWNCSGIEYAVFGLNIALLFGWGLLAARSRPPRGAADALARSGTATAAVFAVVAGCTVAFIRTERRAAAPLIPPSLFRDRAVARGIATTGLAGVSLFGGFTFIPLAVRQGTGVGDGAPVCSCSR